MELIKTLGNDSRDKKKEFLWPLGCPYKHANRDRGSQIPWASDFTSFFFCKKSGWKQWQ